jgi:hypothetical protein
MRSGPCSQGTESDPDFTPLPLSANQYLETKTLYFATITLQKSGIALVLCRCPYRCVVFKYRLEARVCDKCLIQPSFGKSCDWEIGTELSFRSLKRVRPRFFYPPTIMIRLLGLLFALRLRLILTFFTFRFLAMSIPQSQNHSRILSNCPNSANAKIFGL